jgi:hypothetical protein
LLEKLFLQVKNICKKRPIIAPILSGGIELMKKWNEENIVNNKEHDA